MPGNSAREGREVGAGVDVDVMVGVTSGWGVLVTVGVRVVVGGDVQVNA